MNKNHKSTGSLRTRLSVLTLALLLTLSVSGRAFAEEEIAENPTPENIPVEEESAEDPLAEVPEESLNMNLLGIEAEDSGADLDPDGENQAKPQMDYEFILASSPNTVNTTKVSVTWTITPVTVTYGSTRTWDTENLQWVEEDPSYSATGGTAEFTFTNYGSVNVKAEVTYEVAEGMTDAVKQVAYENNSCVVETPVVTQPEKTEYEDSDFTALQQKITSTVTVDPEKFAGMTDGQTDKLLTYTVTVSSVSEE